LRYTTEDIGPKANRQKNAISFPSFVCIIVSAGEKFEEDFITHVHDALSNYKFLAHEFVAQQTSWRDVRDIFRKLSENDQIECISGIYRHSLDKVKLKMKRTGTRSTYQRNPESEAGKLRQFRAKMKKVLHHVIFNSLVRM